MVLIGYKHDRIYTCISNRRQFYKCRNTDQSWATLRENNRSYILLKTKYNILDSNPCIGNMSSAKWRPSCSGIMLSNNIHHAVVMIVIQGKHGKVGHDSEMFWWKFGRCDCGSHDCHPKSPGTNTTMLTHLLLHKMTAISQTIFSDAFSWMERFVFWLKFHWSSFLRI